VAIIHLAILGYSGDDLVNFEIAMASPSTIAQQQRLELWRTRFEVAGMAQEGVLDRGTIYRDIFNFNDRKIARIKEGKRVDKLEDQLLGSIEAPPPGEEGAMSGGGGNPAPGSEELPQTLGGAEGGGEQSQGEPPPVTAGLSHGTPDMMVTDARNPGSQGNQAELSTAFGKDLFAPGEDLLAHTFGTEKQTASDPFDMRALHRAISRPFSGNEAGEAIATDVDPGAQSVDEAAELEGELLWLRKWLASRRS